MGEERGWTLNDLPIPADVKPDDKWPMQLVEMADHIGAYATLLIAERFGGRDLYIAKTTDHYRIDDLIGKDKGDVIRWVYGATRVTIPTAKELLTRVRREPVIAMARKNFISVTEAARRCKTTRSYMSYLMNRTDEGKGIDPPPPPRPPRDLRQIEMFDTDPDR